MSVTVKKLQAKSHNEPDEVRSPPKTRVEVVNLDGFTMGASILNRDGAGRNA
ncbi:MAG: hypothetical protein R3E89_09715 [Thiolinea sp.]